MALTANYFQSFVRIQIPTTHTLLLLAEVKWLSRDQILRRLLLLKGEIEILLT